MAPSRTSTVKSKHAANKSGLRTSKSRNRPENEGVSKRKAPKTGKGSIPMKGRGGNAAGGVIKKKNRRIYTEKELDIPALNMITPVGVEKPKGGKKGKVFVDDRESMMTILAIVNADKDGQIESKMMKARQMEEIRDARKAEADKRMELKKAKLDETKESIRRKRKRTSATDEKVNRTKEVAAGTKSLKVKRKSVSFE
ncbi:MAG: 60S ribosomal subunit assembly/export protein [Claussenomyces sp. TS43310]|nr:MAG: 60S ribosomal subunit assembly/export protein [Claussenomyces sp. TS43310]